MKPIELAKKAASEVIDAMGGPTALAELLDTSPQAVNNWRNRGVSTKRVLDVEKVSGKSRYELRPDIYGTAQ